jgi:large subunit ribosomal protein L10
MTKEQKNEVIEALKEKFSQYTSFYVTNTESLSVDQVGKLRRICFDKNVEMKVAKNTLIKKALESLDGDRYSSVFESLNGVTALLFSENPKEPALIISDFRRDNKGELPALKAAFIDGAVFAGDNQLEALKAGPNRRSDRLAAIAGQARDLWTERRRQARQPGKSVGRKSTGVNTCYNSGSLIHLDLNPES